MSGVPQQVTLLTRDDPGIVPLFGRPQWGVFSQYGQPILVAESVSELEFDREYDISKYPQEGAPGSPSRFESFNKVQVPFSAKITVLSNRTRQQLLQTLEPLTASLQLVSVVMPEIAYFNANINRYSFRRTARSGVTLIAIDLWIEEVRFGSSMLTSSATAPQQPQATGGTQRPIGQVAPGTNLAPGSSANQDFSGGTATTGAGNQQGAYIPIKNLPSQEGQTIAIPPANQAGQTIPIPPASQAGQTIPIPPASQAGQFIPIPSATNTASTNAASPTSSGPVQAINPADAPSDWGVVDLTAPPN